MNVERYAQSLLGGAVHLDKADLGAHQCGVEFVLPLHAKQLIRWQQTLALFVPSRAEHYNPMLDDVPSAFQDIASKGEAIQSGRLTVLAEFHADLSALCCGWCSTVG